MDLRVGLLDWLWTAKLASWRLWTSKLSSRERFGPPSEPLWAARSVQEPPRAAREPLWSGQGSPNGSPDNSSGLQKALQRLSKSTRSSNKAKLLNHRFYQGKSRFFNVWELSEVPRKVLGRRLDLQVGLLDRLWTAEMAS